MHWTCIVCPPVAALEDNDNVVLWNWILDVLYTGIAGFKHS